MSEHAEGTAAGRLQADHCRHLCTKSLFTGSQNGLPPVPEELVADTAAWWCELTQTCFGPDEEPVEPETCRTGRRCAQRRLPPAV